MIILIYNHDALLVTNVQYHSSLIIIIMMVCINRNQTRMSADIDAHVTSQYEINKRIGKGVSFNYNAHYYG